LYDYISLYGCSVKRLKQKVAHIVYYETDNWSIYFINNKAVGMTEGRECLALSSG
jgi:hypothetical protein